MGSLLLMYGRMQPTAAHLARLAAIEARLDVVVAASRDEAVAAAPGADVFIGHSYLRHALPAAPRVRWVQSLLAGVEGLASPALFAQRPLLTRCPIFSDVIAMHAVTMAYAVVRRLPEVAQAQARGLSRRPPALLPTPRTALVLGLGMIGLEIARMLRALGLQVTGVATTSSAEKDAAVDRFVAAGDWRAALPGSDLCFVTLPATTETEGMMDAAALRALPDHAVLINVGRGQTVDTAALVAALGAGELGGAALDVIDPSPNGHDDPLWQTPHLLITPHMASFTPGRQERIEAFVEEQVRRFATGDPLLYPVDLDRLQEESLRA